MQNLDAKIFSNEEATHLEQKTKIKIEKYNPLRILADLKSGDLEQMMELAEKRHVLKIFSEVRADEFEYFKEFMNAIDMNIQ